MKTPEKYKLMEKKRAIIWGDFLKADNGFHN
jgi:hypothetical protein